MEASTCNFHAVGLSNLRRLGNAVASATRPWSVSILCAVVGALVGAALMQQSQSGGTKAGVVSMSALGAAHPLDPVSEQEMDAALGALRAWQGSKGWREITVELKPPPKSGVLCWEKGHACGSDLSREMMIVTRNTVNRTTWKVLFALANGRDSQTHATFLSASEIQGMPGIHSVDMTLAGKVAIADGRVQQAIAARGVALEDVVFDYDSCGLLCASEKGSTSARELVVEVYSSAQSNNFYTRPLNLAVFMDMDSMKIIRVLDTHLPAHELPPAKGSNFTWPLSFLGLPTPSTAKSVRSTQIDWNGWNAHVRTDWRSGFVISLARFAGRHVAYEMALSEMVVPYQSPRPEWVYRTFLDEGEFGLGSNANQLDAEVCGRDASYLDLVDVSHDGGPLLLKNVVCIFERKTGDPLWMHGAACWPTGPGQGQKCARAQVRQNVELVVRMSTRVGNYDYLMDVIFRMDASIKTTLGATGINAVRAREPGEEKANDGVMFAPSRVAPFHDHWFCMRIDLDIDAPAKNSFQTVKIMKHRQPEGAPRATLWAPEVSTAKHENDAMRRLGIATDEIWTVINSDGAEDRPAGPRGYALLPGTPSHHGMEDGDPLLARAPFLKHDLWVTPYSPEELYASGAFPNQSPGRETIAKWTSKNRPIADTDIVLWHTFGFHHVPAMENFPILNTVSTSFTLQPNNFFDRNPAA